jgi:RHS repeat-associated protein
MTDVKAGDALPHLLVTESIYDPEVEFLEIANTINGKRTWKIHGPDLDGSFGGLQGIGGLESTIQETGNISTGILTDAFGNGVGTISGTSLTWHPNRVGSYGALPGHVSLTPNESVTIAQATAWRGKTADATGFHYLGARYYEPNGGRFLSADPAGHSASISLYDYANGDPVNFADPDGRIGKSIGSSLGIQSSSSSGISYPAPSYGITNNSFKTVSTFTPTNSAGNILSAGFNMIPVLGTVKSYIELSSGNDLFTGAQISHSQSAFNVLASAVPFAAGPVSRFGTQAAGSSIGAITGSTMNVSRPALNIGGAAKGTIPSAGGVIRQFEQQGAQTYYRVFSGDATTGQWLTAVPPRSSAWAQEALALPRNNSANLIQEVIVPNGTMLERSRAIPMPDWGRMRGGAEQFKLLERIPDANFGPGVPLR